MNDFIATAYGGLGPPVQSFQLCLVMGSLRYNNGGGRCRDEVASAHDQQEYKNI
jgi:hypothetical protein